MAFAVAVKLTARAGEEERVERALREMIPRSRAEEGCRLYEVHRTAEDARLFYLYEQYDDEAAYEAHRTTAHYEQYLRGEVMDRLEKRHVERYETLE